MHSIRDMYILTHVYHVTCTPSCTLTIYESQPYIEGELFSNSLRGIKRSGPLPASSSTLAVVLRHLLLGRVATPSCDAPASDLLVWRLVLLRNAYGGEWRG